MICEDGPMCPVCCSAVLQATQRQGALGFCYRAALVCPRCGATLVQPNDDPARLKLVATRQPTQPNWRSYAQLCLTVIEWHRISHGGASDATQREIDLSEATSALNQGKVSR